MAFQPNNNAVAMQNNKNNNASSENPEEELNLDISLGGFYATRINTSNASSRVKTLAQSSTVAGVLTLEEPQMTQQQSVAAPLPTLELGRSSSTLAAGRQQRMIRHKDVLALRRQEIKQRLAERQKNEQLAAAAAAAAASLQEQTRPPAAVPQLTAWSISAVPDGTGASSSSSTVYQFKAEGFVTVSSDPKGASPDIKPMITSAEVTIAEHTNHAQNSHENPSKRVRISGGNVLDKEDVDSKRPCVRTFGPDGRTVEGVLYSYQQGQVSIKCVCHGSVFFPAEFVKHAGGSEVANPLRNIIVCPTPSDD